MDAEFIVRQVITVAGGFGAVSATFLLGHKYRGGFIVKALAQIPVAYIAVTTETWGMLAYSIPLVAVSIHGWWRWRNNG